MEIEGMLDELETERARARKDANTVPPAPPRKPREDDLDIDAVWR